MGMSVDEARCLGCAACAAVCPEDALTLVRGTPEFSEDCTECSWCARVCPVGAIEPKG